MQNPIFQADIANYAHLGEPLLYRFILFELSYESVKRPFLYVLRKKYT